MKKILIVEDERMLAEMYKDRFTQEGFEVYCAPDAEEGIETAQKVRPDLIILDILLPRENGTDFLEKLRKMEEIASTPVVAFSNYDDTDSKKKAMNLGAKDYLIKTDHTPKEILEKVREYLEE